MRSRPSPQPEFESILDAPVRKRGERGWGGARRGAGRKANPKPRYVRHRRRQPHAKSRPVHITVKALKGLPSFRRQSIHNMLLKVLRNQIYVLRKYSNAFKVVHFSIQTNHLHIMVEAHDGKALRSGVSGLVIAFARQLAKLLGRAKCKVWAERYHSRELHAPRDVRNVLSYIFQSYEHHETTHGTGIVDRYSSARWFDGWYQEVRIGTPIDESAYMRGPPTWVPAQPSTWLLQRGWRDEHGRLNTMDRPADRPRGAALR